MSRRNLNDYQPRCPHTAPLRFVKHLKANGAVMVQRECSFCGEWSYEVPHRFLAFNPDSAPPRDAAKRAATNAERCAAWRAAAAAEREERNRIWWERYNAYLGSPAWAARRVSILSRAGGKCELCRVRRATQVHHTTYVHVGNERPDELVALCGECHEAATVAQRLMNARGGA